MEGVAIILQDQPTCCISTEQSLLMLAIRRAVTVHCAIANRLFSSSISTQTLLKTDPKMESSKDTKETKIVTPSEEAIDQCVSVLRKGGLIAVPTDTIYGIAASAINSEAIEKLYSVKGREKTKPIAICVGRPSDVDRYEDSTFH